jgi:competence protein ComEA
MRQDGYAIRLNARAVLLIALFLSLSGCVKRERQIQSSANDRQTFASIPALAKPESAPRININTAAAAELEKLPGIGPALAERIIEHRGKYGAFRRPEHLIIVPGISDRRFRALRDLITVE